MKRFLKTEPSFITGSNSWLLFSVLDSKLVLRDLFCYFVVAGFGKGAERHVLVREPS
jgi:hypothetical protein